MGLYQFILLLPPLLLNLADFASSSPLYYSCSGTGNFPSNSNYATNLDGLLRSLASTGPVTGFSNNTRGSEPDRVYGLVLCRGDVTRDACKTCLQTGITEMRQLCPNRPGAGIWYDDCRLRYSDQNFFSKVDDSGKVNLGSNENISDPLPFNRILGEMLRNLSREAAFNRSSRMFATGEASFNGSNKLYGLVQCSRDLQPGDCSKCLNSTLTDLESCCFGKQGGRILGLSCNLRFELYRFFGGPASSPPPTTGPQDGSESTSRKIIKIILPTIAAVALLCGLSVYLVKRKGEMVIREWQEKNEGFVDRSMIAALESSEDPLQFEFETIKAATNNFSPSCKLGEGGFGSVYQGRLASGREIAVKRLSGNSGQGIEEFRNEVLLIAKLQHRNLVRHFGFCVQGDEKILIYEFVHNKSLDYFLFDRNKRGHLDWEIRTKIIEGIARGLLYLHEDSRLKIIHRDLKASNILLDREMNPKIADFGMSRIFKADQTTGNTSRIAGTFGYMSPEYAMHGQFSPKSDVYSFGVLVLEILSGQKNTNFYQSTGAEDLLSYAWRLWKGGMVLDLLDPCLKESCPTTEAMRFVHIGLLCVQENVIDRPSMSTVVLMLNSGSVTVPAPCPPAYFVSSKIASDIFSKEFDWQVSQSDASMSKLGTVSTNDNSVTQLYPR